MKKFLLLLIVLFIITTGCDSEKISFSDNTKTAFQNAADSYFTAATKKSGISVAVYKDGYLPWTYAKGDAAAGVAMTTDTPTFAFSITKTMVSALVLTQIEKGMYSLTDTVEDLLSDQADYASFNLARINKDATVEDLLKHISGMPDYAGNFPAQVAMCNPDITWKPADILNKIVNLDWSSANWTGHVYNYSNTNYVLLGLIAEHKSGSSLNELLKNTFFNKLKIEAAIAPQDSVPANIAHPYDESAIFGASYGFYDLTVILAGGYPTFNYFLGTGRSTWTAGGVMATAENLAQWGFNLYDSHGCAVSPSVRKKLKDSVSKDGDYGYGVFYNTFSYADGTPGKKYGHGGGGPGYRTLMRYETNQRISIVVLTNANDTIADQGLVDREALVNALLNAYKDNQ